MSKRTAVHQRYKTADGKTVPSVTAVLSLLNKPALVRWAWKQGCEGLDYEKVSKESSIVGDIAHAMIENHLDAKPLDTSIYSMVDQITATNCFRKFKAFWEREGFTSIAGELPLVSARYSYGGCLDRIAMDRNGLRTLLDWKSSRSLHLEYDMQLSAYEQLWNEAHPDEPIQRRMIVRIGKGGVFDFEVRELFDTAKLFDAFLAVLNAHYAMEKITEK